MRNVVDSVTGKAEVQIEFRIDGHTYVRSYFYKRERGFKVYRRNLELKKKKIFLLANTFCIEEFSDFQKEFL